MSQDEKEPSEYISELRTKFPELYKESIEKKAYDARDLERLQTEDAYTLRFVYHQQFDIKKAAAQVDASLKFRKDFAINDLKESSFDRWMHELGAVYFRNKSKEDHDILFFKVSKTKKDPDNNFKVKQFIAWWIDKSFSKWPDKPIVVLFDMTDVGLSNVDVDLIKYQVSCFTTFFPGMLAYMLIYEMPWVLNAIWKLIRNLLTAEQQKRVLFVKKSNIQDHVAASSLPLHMGGTDDYTYKYLPTEDSGIDIPTGDDSPAQEIPILNGHVTDDEHFANCGSSTSLTSQASLESLAGGSSANAIVSSASQPLSSSTSSPLTTSSPVRKRVTFSEEGDTQIPADQQSSSSARQHGESSKGRAMSSNQSAFQNAIVTISPAEHLMFLVTDESRETQDSIVVTNTSANTLAFKIKTTNPDSFRVRPSTGLVRAGESSEIFVYLQPGCYENVSREKFLIMIMQVEDGVKLSSLSDKWRNPPRDPEQYLEHRLWCTMKSAAENQQQDTLARCEDVLNTLTKQMCKECPKEQEVYDEVVNEITKSQQRLEQRLGRVLGCQLLLGVVIFLLGLALIATFFFDVNPFSSCSNSSIYSACSPYDAWKD